MRTTIATLLFSVGLIGSVHADPVTALSCVSKQTKTFATVGIKTGLFAPSAPQQILQYDVRVGKLGTNGEVKSESIYELESNMKIFDDADQAYAWVKSNTVVIALSEGKATHGSILVELAKKKITVIDTDYETIEVLDCLVN